MAALRRAGSATVGKRLCVFPADPLAAYVRKGEVKPRYYNPDNLFDEVHFVTTDTGPVDPAALQILVGDAHPKLHALGEWSVLSLRQSPYVGPYPARVARMAREIRPDVVRGYTPVESGWLARVAARAAGVPYVVSVHGNFDLDIRTQLRHQRRWRGWAYFTATRWLVERPVLRDAARVMCVYEYAALYARAIRPVGVEVIYNRVDLSRFHAVPRDGPFTVLFIGRYEENKGHELLLRAIARGPYKLILVGDGRTKPAMERLAAELRLGERVEFIPSVSHAEIATLYERASCYANAIEYGGISIAQIEAMACGLPIVVARSPYDPAPEQVADVALMVDRTPEAVASALDRLATDRALADGLARRSLARAQELDGRQMERRERELYEAVLAAPRGRGTGTSL